MCWEKSDIFWRFDMHATSDFLSLAPLNHSLYAVDNSLRLREMGRTAALRGRAGIGFHALRVHNWPTRDRRRENITVPLKM